MNKVTKISSLKRKNKYLIVAFLVIIGLILAVGFFPYQPPLINSGMRNPREWVCDLFSFGWHFSRLAWMRQSRDWPGATRERLLAFWYRPGYPAYDELRKKSLMELAREYDKVLLSGQATELYLYLHRGDIGNYWLARKVGARLYRLKDWDKLEIVARDIMKYHPGNEDAQRWLEISEKNIE